MTEGIKPCLDGLGWEYILPSLPNGLHPPNLLLQCMFLTLHSSYRHNAELPFTVNGQNVLGLSRVSYLHTGASQSRSPSSSYCAKQGHLESSFGTQNSDAWGPGRLTGLGWLSIPQLDRSYLFVGGFII